MIDRRASRLAVLPALILALVATWGFTQTTPSILKGVVVDKDGNPLPGVTVILENPSLGHPPMGGVTNAQGEFRITPVPGGKGYVLRASMPSYQKIEFRDIEIPQGRTIVQNITLRPEFKVVERVEGKEDVVNTETTKISTTISSEFISGLPVLGRDYQDVLTLAPGVTDVNNTGNPNIHGARDTDVVTLVDGVSTTDPFTGQFGQNLNAESIEEIEVITSGASAEFSRAQGGFVKIITKSGGNEFKGTARFEMRSNKLDGDGAGIDAADVRGGLGERDGFRNISFTDLYPFLSVSGPFIKDHLFYYFAPEYSQEETPVNAGTQAFVQTTKSQRVTAKVTWNMTADNRLTFTGLWDDEKNYNLGLNSVTDRDAAYTFGRGGPTLTLSENAIFNPSLSLESTISRFDQTHFDEPNTDPDTNGNGILTTDKRPDLGGNNDGFINLRERDPGWDFDFDGRFDVFEDFNGDGKLSGCVDVFDPQTLLTTKVCHPPDAPSGEDLDWDGRLTHPVVGCEGPNREDVNCNGFLDFETDRNEDGDVDPDEDLGIPCANISLCPGGYIPGTRGNGVLDTEDKNGNNSLDDTPFPDWADANHNGIPERGEFTAPLAPDRQYTVNFNTNRISGPYVITDRDSRTRDSLKEDLSYYIDDLLGSHDIKMGVAFEKEGYHSHRTRRPSFQVSTGAVDQATGQVGGTIGSFLATQENAVNAADSNNMGFYIHDIYKPLPNLTLSLGVRFDREEVSSHGFDFFDPAEQRREFDILMGVFGLEGKQNQDFNKDGFLDKGLTMDPLYSAQAPPWSTIESGLATVAPQRFTQHNFRTTTTLGKNTLTNGGPPRAPQDFTITNNNLAPRLSVSWDPWANGKTKATAGWGRFYDKLFLSSVINEEGPDLLNPYYQYDVDGVNFAGLPDNRVGRAISLPYPNAFQIDREMRTPFTDEMTIGFQREIAPEVSISVNFIRRKFRDQLQDIDANHSVRKATATLCAGTEEHTLNGYCDTLGLTTVVPAQGNGDGVGEVVPDKYPDLFINNYFFNQILRIGNFNYQQYHAYEVTLSRRLSRKWLMDASYVFSKATGQAEAFTSESGDDPSLTELKNGALDFDQRHVVKFHAISYLPGDWQIGGGLTWSSGLPFSFVNRFQSGDDNNFTQTRRLYGYKDPNTGDFIAEDRNIHRNKAVYSLDARTEKRFVIGRITAGAFFSVVNILNADNLRVAEIDNRVRTLQSLETRDFGRRFQFGIRMDF
jgi:outer membrane receptor protein involved in Fe transport